MVLVVATLMFGASAQPKKTVHLEALAGWSYAGVNGGKTDYRNAFHVGARVVKDFPNQRHEDQYIYVTGGAMLSLKGYSKNKVYFNPYYLNIPIHCGYKFQFDEFFALFGELGPYFDIGLFGKTDGQDVFSDEIDCKRFNFGLGIQGGVEICNKVSVSLGYEHGFLNSLPEFSSKNRTMLFTLGYRF